MATLTFFSSSALRYSTEYQNINTDEITAISACGTVKGPKLGLDIYSVHLIEPVLMLMKATPSRLMITPSRYEDFTLTLLFDDGRIANICGFTGKTKYTMNISARDENKSLTVASDFFGEFYKVLVEFFKTHTLPFPTEETIAVMAVREAAIKALDTPNTWVEI